MKPEETLKDPVPVYVFHIPSKQARSTKRLLVGQRILDLSNSMMFLAQKHNILGFCTPDKQTLELYFYFKKEEDLLGFYDDFGKLSIPKRILSLSINERNTPSRWSEPISRDIMMKDNPIIVGIALGMALFLFAPIVALIAFPREYILPTFIGIGIDILFVVIAFQIF